ncbi:MAG TPA: hypothetical protein VN255_10835, partial [Mycobacterium sp.]|nr:hypothetical protein [Mycobacterium sp.]
MPADQWERLAGLRERSYRRRAVSEYPRARGVVTDPATGRSALRFLPGFETISYADLWARVQVVAADWHHHEHPVRAGDFVCVLGFASIDYTAIECACIHLGAVV